MSEPIYLDYAAATPLAPEAFVVMFPYFRDKFYNPSATYLAAIDIKKDLETARASVAGQLGTRPREIIFTAGGSEANNLAIRGVLEAFPGKKIVTSSIEHDSVLITTQHYAHAFAPVNSQGQLDVAATEALIDDNTVLVSCMLVNNEVGTIQPITKLAGVIEGIRAKRKTAGNTLPLYLHTDACQAGLYLDLHVSRLGVDMMTLNGGKIYGPKQSGILFIKNGVQLHPQILGGGQERGMRSGTENVAFAVGFAWALSAAQANRHQEGKRVSDLQRQFITGLQTAIPSVIINGSVKNRLPNNVHVTFPGQDNERLLFALDEQGIMAAAGSACSASSDEPSHVLKAMGISEQDAQSSLRFSMGHDTTSEAIERVIAVLSELVSA